MKLINHKEGKCNEETLIVNVGFKNHKNRRLNDKIDVNYDEDQLQVIWEFITQRANVRENIYSQIIKSKDKLKQWYDYEVTLKSFALSDMILLWDLTPHLEKLFPWNTEPYIVTGYKGEHKTSYTL